MKKLILLLLFIPLVFSCSKEPVVYTLTGTANPLEGGTVTPSSQQYNSGDLATISATPNSEYVFQNWSGAASGNSSSTSITMDSDKSVVANFVKKKYALTIETQGEGEVNKKIIQAGITDTSEHNSGTIIELTANPSSEWEFKEWEGDLSGTENPKQITIDKPKSITAIFVKKKYLLNIEVEGEGSITSNLSNDNKYESGTVVKLLATPSSEYWEFREWEGDLSGNTNPEYITMDKSKSVKVIFSRIERVLTIDLRGNGSATIKADDGTDQITISEKTDLKYFKGTKLEITAIADQDWSFVNFSKSQSSSPDDNNPIEIDLLHNYTTTIKFNYTKPMVDADGNSYEVVTIPYYDDDGNYIKDLVWTKNNFRGTKFNDGTEIKTYNLSAVRNYYGSPYTRSEMKEEFVSLMDETDPALLIYTNSQIIQKDGYWYNEYVVKSNKKIAPDGWRIATFDDFKSLINFGEALNLDAQNIAKMHMTVGFSTYNGSGGVGWNYSGFSAVASAGVWKNMCNSNYTGYFREGNHVGQWGAFYWTSDGNNIFQIANRCENSTGQLINFPVTYSGSWVPALLSIRFVKED